MPMPKRVEDFLASASAPEPCMHEGCTAMATKKLKIRLWAIGYPLTSTPITAYMTFKLCDAHTYEVKPETFWTEEAKDRITMGVIAAGRVEPDFARAEFTWVPLSDGWQV